MPDSDNELGRFGIHEAMACLRDRMSGGPGSRVTTWFRNITREGWAWEAFRQHPGKTNYPPVNQLWNIFAVFLNSSWDHNRQQPRFDLIGVWPAGDPPDGHEPTFVRIHPGSSKWGVAVKARTLRAWIPAQDEALYPDLFALESTQSRFDRIVSRVGSSERGTFIGLHQLDMVTKRQACEFIEKYTQAWCDLEHPRTRFAKDLTDERDFKWFRWVKNSN